MQAVIEVKLTLAGRFQIILVKGLCRLDSVQARVLSR